MKLNFTFQYNKTSFGYHGAYTLKHLQAKGWDVRHIPVISGPQNDIDAGFPQPKYPFHHDAPSLRLWHPNNMAQFTGSPKITFTVFELEELSDIEVHNLSYPDKVLVPTKWAADVCDKHGIKASIVPLGYDEDIFLPAAPEEQDHTVFANFGKWEIRKGHDILIKAFNAAFEKTDSVTLVMMPTNGFLNFNQVRAWERMYLESKLGNNIQIVPRLESHRDVYNVMKQIDCAVFPARAEGWNMEALEIMGCGKEIIITNCTGHTGFINESCRMVEMKEEFEPAYDGVFFNGTSRWRKFTQSSFEQLVEHMRTVHKNRSSLRLNEAAVAQASKFTWKEATDVLEKEICSTKK